MQYYSNCNQICYLEKTFLDELMMKEFQVLVKLLSVSQPVLVVFLRTLCAMVWQTALISVMSLSKIARVSSLRSSWPPLDLGVC